MPRNRNMGCSMRQLVLLLLPQFWAPQLPSNVHPVRICTIQPLEGLGSRASALSPSLRGADAVRLADELAKRPLASGYSIVGLPITKATRSDSENEAKQQHCDYIVELWRHEGFDRNDSAPSPGSTGSVSSIHDRDAVLFELSAPSTRKVLLKGSAPPPTIYGRSDHVFSPYVLFATEIVKKIERSHDR